MPFNKRPNPLPREVPAKSRKFFIGRENELRFFIEHILQPEDPAYNIISVSGNGGVGKTTLLARFIDQARSSHFGEYCSTALADEQQLTPQAVMEKFSLQLHEAGSPLVTFEKALIQYKETLLKLQIEREAAQDTAVREAVDLVGSAVEVVPGVGGVFHKGANMVADLYLKEHRSHQLLKDHLLLENPIGDLTKSFIEGLNQLADLQVTLSSNRARRWQRIILFFDTFEKQAPEVAPWLLNHFLQANISTNVVIVVAGRDSILHSTPDDPKRWLPYRDEGIIYFINLDSFTIGETRAYLEARGITNPASVDTIWQLSRGLPLYLGFLTFNPQGKVDPTTDVVDNFLRWIPKSEKDKRDLALHAALFSRPFDLDDLSAFTDLLAEKRSTLFSWLVKLPFVRNNPQDGRYHYHDLAQEMFRRYLYQLSQHDYYATIHALARHYRLQVEEIQGEQGKEVNHSDESLEAVLALIYQLFTLPEEASHTEASERARNAYRHSNAEQKAKVIKFLRDLSNEHQYNRMNVDSLSSASRLLQYVEADMDGQKEKVCEAITNLLKKAVHRQGISSEFLAGMYRERGLAYADLKEYQHAFQDFDRAIELAPALAQSYTSRGWAYRRFLKDDQRAIQDYTHAIELDPNYALAYNNRGYTYWTLKEYQRAIKDLDRAVELNPNYALAYSNRGLVLIKLEEYPRAFQDFDRAIELDPNHSWIYDSRGWVYLNLKEYQRAIQDFDRAVELDHDFAGAYANRGRAYSKLGEYQRAIHDFDRAIELDPTDIWAYNNRGWAYRKLGEYQQAMQDFDRAIELDSTNPWTYANRCWAYLDLKDYQRAIQDCNYALGLDPNFARAYNGRGYTFWKLKEYQRAIQDYDRAIELDSANPWQYANRGLAYASLKEYQRAIQDFDRAIELDPRDASSHFRRGYAHLNKNNIQQARADFNASWQIDSTVANYGWMAIWSSMCEGSANSELAEQLEAIVGMDAQQHEVLLCRGVAQWLRGEYKEALIDFEKTISLRPNSEDAFFWKGMAYASLGEYQEAQTAIEKSLELELPPVLLYMLQWFEHRRTDFYEKYAIPLLAQATI